MEEHSAMLEKAVSRTLGDAEWQKTSGKPVLNVTVNATKTGEQRYQYSVTY